MCNVVFENKNNNNYLKSTLCFCLTTTQKVRNCYIEAPVCTYSVINSDYFGPEHALVCATSNKICSQPQESCVKPTSSFTHMHVSLSVVKSVSQQEHFIRSDSSVLNLHRCISTTKAQSSVLHNFPGLHHDMHRQLTSNVHSFFVNYS